MMRFLHWLRSLFAVPPSPSADDYQDCSNCTHTYPRSRADCPVCGAGADGNGAVLAMDEAVRAAAQQCGGVVDGQLESATLPLLVCERGVVAIRGGALAWSWSGERVFDVEQRDERVWVTTDQGDVCLHQADGRVA